MHQNPKVSKHLRTGSSIASYPNVGNDCVFSPWVGVQPHSLSQLSSLMERGVEVGGFGVAEESFA